MTFAIRNLQPLDRDWVEGVLVANWGSTRIVTRGQVHKALALLGFAAHLGGEPAGLVLYQIEGEACEIVALTSLQERRGIGSALIEAVTEEARMASCKRVWLVTTNDNQAAQRFYMKRGFAIAAVYEGAVDRSRALKPEIPALGQNGIPIRDEIEMEICL